jgi:anti-sigma-K factor RskA
VLPADKDIPPVPAGTFKPDANSSGTVVMPDVPKGIAAKGFGVTIEDDGGSKQPTSAIVLAGF